jgi:hypothetical protein
MRYLYERYHPVYHCQPSEVMGAIGAMESFGAVFTLSRNVLPFLPALAFVEFCVNDRGCPKPDLVRKGMEGIVRQLRSAKTRPDIVVVGAGVRPGSDPHTGDLVDHALHREVADHYGLGFIDVQDYLHRTLARRGQTWDDVSIVFEEGDNYHLNDYGNHLWFEAVREWFEEQVLRFDADPTARPAREAVTPLVSDEFEHTRLVNPAKRSKQVALEGGWAKKDPGVVPWYLDNLLVGRPGDRMTFTFTGTAIGVMALVHANGLKIEARLDGRDIAGPYTNFGIEFGKFFLLEHGLADGEHVLELEVAAPMTRQNKLPDPTAEIGYLAVASRPEA